MNLFRTYNIKRLLFLFIVIIGIWVLISKTTDRREMISTGDSSSPKSLIIQTTIPVRDTPRVDHTRIEAKETKIQVLSPKDIPMGKTDPAVLVAFAKTLLGVPYVYASTDPKVGFDCSGFITYVFHHFNIQVPRSSIDFANVGKTVAVGEAKTGDLILFTGTNEHERYIGHMGIVISNDNAGILQFIHATSGKAMAVAISVLNESYQRRFIRVSRVFPQNG